MIDDTNGGDSGCDGPEYDFSETYSLLSRRNRLYEVLQILKGIGLVMIQEGEAIILDLK